MSSLWYVKGDLLTGLLKVTKMASNSFDQERLEHLVYSAHLPSPRHCFFVALGYRHFEGSMTEKQAHHGTAMEFTKGGRCAYISLK